MKHPSLVIHALVTATMCAATPAEAAGFCFSTMPISTSGLRINSGFGVWRNLSQSKGWHMGLDLSDAAGCGQGRKGEPVKAGHAGTVEVKGSASDRGNGGLKVLLRSGPYKSVYMHLQDAAVEDGKSVAAGDVIGHCGDSGAPGIPHLHLGMLASGATANTFGDSKSFRWGQSKLAPALTASAIHDSSPEPLYLVNPENFLPQSIPYKAGGQSASCSGGAPPIDTSTNNPEKPPTSQSAASPKKDMAAGEASARSGEEGVIASQAALERRGVVVDIAKTMALDLRTNDTEEQDAIDSAQAHMLLLALDPKNRGNAPMKQAEASNK